MTGNAQTAVEGDGSALWAGVLASRDDAAAKLVYADWLDDRAERPELAYALRWCAKRCKHPARRVTFKAKYAASQFVWAWFNYCLRMQVVDDFDSRERDNLPDWVFGAIDTKGFDPRSWGKHYQLATEAEPLFDALGRALLSLREEVSV